MDNLKRKEGDFFDQFGLELVQGQVELGQTYPIFGMITSFEFDGDEKVVAEINNNIIARFKVSESNIIDVLKEKAFETGIFISTVTAIEPQVEVTCQAVIFGKPQSYNA